MFCSTCKNELSPTNDKDADSCTGNFRLPVI